MIFENLKLRGSKMELLKYKKCVSLTHPWHNASIPIQGAEWRYGTEVRKVSVASRRSNRHQHAGRNRTCNPAARWNVETYIEDDGKSWRSLWNFQWMVCIPNRCCRLVPAGKEKVSLKNCVYSIFGLIIQNIYEMNQTDQSNVNSSSVFRNKSKSFVTL